MNLHLRLESRINSTGVDSCLPDELTFKLNWISSVPLSISPKNRRSRNDEEQQANFDPKNQSRNCRLSGLQRSPKHWRWRRAEFCANLHWTDSDIFCDSWWNMLWSWVQSIPRPLIWSIKPAARTLQCQLYTGSWCVGTIWSHQQQQQQQHQHQHQHPIASASHRPRTELILFAMTWQQLCSWISRCHQSRRIGCCMLCAGILDAGYPAIFAIYILIPSRRAN